MEATLTRQVMDYSHISAELLDALDTWAQEPWLSQSDNQDKMWFKIFHAWSLYKKMIYPNRLKNLFLKYISFSSTFVFLKEDHKTL